MKIRVFKKDDCEKLAALNREVQDIHIESFPDIFKEPDSGEVVRFFDKISTDPDSHIFVAADGNDLFGYIWAQILNQKENVFKKSRKALYIHQICAKKERRGGGLGKKLIARISGLAEHHGISRIELDVWSKNTNARNSFKAAGFSTVREIMVLED